MRIITGKARGKKLAAPEGLSTRPTSARAKEAVFSVLQFSISGKRVLDLYAGSGQMALEALSRGAASAVAVDSSPEAVRIIKKNAEGSGLSDRLSVVRADAPGWIMSASSRKETFDIVFIDPPYAAGLIPDTLAALVKAGLLADGATVVCESADPGDVTSGRAELEEEFETLRISKYGVAYITYLSPRGRKD
ncbi:MAG: 16S rRNA (guanine(966)-N(2))-methyltransferase RsmD [Clostridia bacterium]|jgi:16S rRNA (guanine(966)-N(2))-methyltransferase RsmD|nr:16S rRNA (guanine(966)-N(2))-methyltransferase RsmD [Clostridia bacterium]